jgi:transposase
MAASFVNIDRNTPMLLPPDMRDWVDDDDLVHFVIEACERLPLEAFRVNERGSGSAQMPPHMMLALLVYCYCNSIFSSRKIERATYRDVAVRYLTANTHPDHDTICKFRRENTAAISASFVDILELARSLGLLKLGKVATDGTHIKANASIDQNVTYDRAVELRERLQADIAELMAEAEKADAEDQNDQSLPEEIARREALKSKMDQAIAELESRAAQRREKAQKDYEAKIKDRKDQEEKTGKKHGGKKPKPPGSVEEMASASNEQCNLTDPDARIMRKNTRSGYTQSYNCQATVDADGSGLIVGQHLTQSASDANELLAAYHSIPDELGKPTAQLADAGYLNSRDITHLQKEEGCEVYCSAHREDAHNERRYDYRPPAKSERPVRELKDPVLIAMRDKLATEEGKAIYKKRASTVETVFGIIKSVLGFRGFSLRGLEKVRGEWGLVCLSHNIKRLHTLKTAMMG